MSTFTKVRLSRKEKNKSLPCIGFAMMQPKKTSKNFTQEDKTPLRIIVGMQVGDEPQLKILIIDKSRKVLIIHDKVFGENYILIILNI